MTFLFIEKNNRHIFKTSPPLLTFFSCAGFVVWTCTTSFFFPQEGCVVGTHSQSAWSPNAGMAEARFPLTLRNSSPLSISQALYSSGGWGVKQLCPGCLRQLAEKYHQLNLFSTQEARAKDCMLRLTWSPHLPDEIGVLWSPLYRW